MALWRCLRCSTVFAVGLYCCPQCTSTNCTEEGGDMPKITRHGGPSNAQLVAEHGPELVDLPAGARVEPATVEKEAGEQSSPGNSSSPSDVKPSTSTAPSVLADPKPAPTTGSRSAKGPKGSSARSTGGAQTGSD